MKTNVKDDLELPVVKFGGLMATALTQLTMANTQYRKAEREFGEQMIRGSLTKADAEKRKVSIGKDLDNLLIRVQIVIDEWRKLNQ